MASLTQLRYALALEHHRNFRRAAAACFVTQPTLSMQVQKLEDELDVVLFDRSRKPVSPTADGERLLTEFRNTVRAYEQIIDVSRELRGVVSGTYRLGIIPTMAPYILPILLSAFTEKYPSVSLRIEEITTEEIIRRLVDESLDGGVLATPIDDRRIVEFALAKECFTVFYSPSLEIPVDDEGRVQLHELPMERLLVMREGHCLRAQTLDLCSLGEAAAHSQKFVIEAGSMATLVAMVQQGEFFTLLPKMAADELKARGLGGQIRPIAEPVPYREIALVVRRTESRRAVRDALVEQAKRVLQPLRTQRKIRKRPTSPF